jgi:Kdo2-lipid IVA lauroyltransferase/acyltransferase
MYYFAYGLVRFFSFLPLGVLYLFADLIYFFVYYVKGYRKKVVLQNLVIAFPEKTEKERQRIAKDFYHKFIDTFIETIKFFSWDIKEINKRFEASMKDVEAQFGHGRPIHIIGMHNFNWEFANWWISARTPVPFLGIYLPVGNRHFDRMIKQMRSKYGTVLIPATDFKSRYESVRNQHHILGVVADQSPADPRNAWWIDFFGRKTAFVRGAERGAIAARASVIFVHFYRVRRGHYRLDTRPFSDDASKLKPGDMTRAYAKFVEESVRSHPSDYLWSHRRWKHDWKEDFGSITI